MAQFLAELNKLTPEAGWTLCFSIGLTLAATIICFLIFCITFYNTVPAMLCNLCNTVINITTQLCTLISNYTKWNAP